MTSIVELVASSVHLQCLCDITLREMFFINAERLKNVKYCFNDLKRWESVINRIDLKPLVQILESLHFQKKRLICFFLKHSRKLWTKQKSVHSSCFLLNCSCISFDGFFHHNKHCFHFLSWLKRTLFSIFSFYFCFFSGKRRICNSLNNINLFLLYCSILSQLLSRFFLSRYKIAHERIYSNICAPSDCLQNSLEIFVRVYLIVMSFQNLFCWSLQKEQNWLRRPRKWWTTQKCTLWDEKITK